MKKILALILMSSVVYMGCQKTPNPSPTPDSPSNDGPSTEAIEENTSF